MATEGLSSYYGTVSPTQTNLRVPYPTEDAYLKNNPSVGGMMTEDGKIILNKYSNLSPAEKEAVYNNESARLYMKANGVPSFDLTPEQIQNLSSTHYGNADVKDQLATIAARIYSGDPSAGKPTPEQLAYVDRLRQGIRDSDVAKQYTSAFADYPGNIDLNNRQVYKIPGGGIKTEESIGVAFDPGDQYSIHIPTVVNGKPVSREEAEKHFIKTGEHLGVTYRKPGESKEDFYKRDEQQSNALHDRQDRYYNKGNNMVPGLANSSVNPTTSLVRTLGIGQEAERDAQIRANNIMRAQHEAVLQNAMRNYQNGNASAEDMYVLKQALPQGGPGSLQTLQTDMSQVQQPMKSALLGR